MKALVLLTLFITSFASASENQNIATLDKIRKTYQVDFKYRNELEWRNNVNKYIAEFTQESTWADIRYDAVDSLDFAPKTHLSRTVILSEAYASDIAEFSKNKKILNIVQRSIDHWLKNDYQSYNWWNNQIGTQQYILKTILLIGNEIGEKRIQSAMKALDRTEMDGRGGAYVGQNLMWRAEIIFGRSLLLGNVREANRASKAIASLLVYDNKEGMQSDGSFLQHGPLIYNGGYGDKFIQMMSKFIYIISGSPFDMTEADKVRFSKFILDNQLWLTRNNKYDYGVLGRSITIKNRTAINLAEACGYLAKALKNFKNRLIACESAILQNQTLNLKGHKSFYRSDFAVQQDPRYFVSFRMHSSRTFNNDAPSNGEGLMSHHLADGAMMLMKDGQEYENIFPVWDWTKIPGTTAVQAPLVPAQFIPGRWDLFSHIRNFGKSTIVGSVSNDHYGASMMKFIIDPKLGNLEAKKSWFTFDNAIWAMGTDINCDNCAPTSTTLNQTLSRSPVIVIHQNNVTKELNGEMSSNSIRAVVHQEVGYFLPKSQSIQVSNKIQKGDWKTINSALKSEVVSRNVFSASIDHGANTQSGEYEYLVVPVIDTQTAIEYRPEDHFEWVKTENAHAVYSRKQNLAQVAFFETNQSIQVGPYQITSDKPALIMLENKNGSLNVLVSDVTQTSWEMNITINQAKYRAQFYKNHLVGKTVIAQPNRN